MNSHERVMNTIQGLPVDRPPVMAVLSAYGGKLTNTDLPTLFKDVDAYIASQQSIQEQFGLDLILAPFDFSVIAEAFGSEIAWFHDQAPNIKSPVACNTAAALALPVPDPHTTARLPFILDTICQLDKIYHEKIPVLAIIPGPCVFPSLLMGLEEWMNTFLFDEESTQKLLDFTGSFFVTWANAILETGATALVITEGMATREIMPRDLFAHRLLPHLRSTFGQVQGPMIFHQTGGKINSMLDLLSDVPNLLGVAVSSKDDLTEARQQIGPQKLLLGNLDNLSFPAATANEIFEKSMACLQTAVPAGPYILCNSGADIPLSTPSENIHALTRASKMYTTRQ